MQAALPSASAERRRFLGVRDPGRPRRDVRFGEACRIDVPAGTLVSVTNVDGGASCLLTALRPGDRTFCLDALELPPRSGAPIDAAAFDSRMMEAMASARGAGAEDGSAYRIFGDSGAPGEVFTTRTVEDAALFLAVPASGDFLAGGGGGRFQIEAAAPPGSNADAGLPEPPGRVVDEWRVERGTAKAYELAKGQFVQIIDVEGQQCSDFMAMRADSLAAGVERHIDSTVSRTMTRSAYPLPGLHDKFFDQDIRPLLAVRQDTVGRHDTFALACTARGYEERGFPGHVNCSDNISGAFAPFGIKARRAWPAINFFFNSWIDWADHDIVSDEAWSRPGDYVLMQALTDLVCVSTACPDDVDPINGWNPTDVHVRVCEEEAPIAHAVAWRARPEDPASLTRHTPLHPRTSRLTGAYSVSRDLWTPLRYDATGAVGEYWACRNGAALQDMSGLRKFDVVGPDALELLQRCLTRDVAKLAEHRGLYALMCDRRGSVLDDGTLFRLEAAAFRWCCGSDDSALHLREQAERLGLDARILSLGHKMASLALQGPKSRDVLIAAAFVQPTRPAVANLKWFGFTIARLGDREGPAFMLTRTGFTGELGYEIFCDADDAAEIWDGLLEAGERCGLCPMGSEAQEIMRIEAGLMAAGAEFGPDCDAMESGLGFAVDFEKGDFIGREALARNAAAVRRRLVGLRMAGGEAPAAGDGVFEGRERVGTVTSACHSPELGHAIAMARIAVENAEAGGEVEVGRLDGHMKRLPATVCALPFIDPERRKPRS